ncbi:MAG TPA: DUF4328 domain-containing protein [Acidimicrobiales bacterium]
MPYGPPQQQAVSASGLALATSILLGIMVLLALVMAAVQFNEYSVVGDFIKTTGDSSFQDLVDADDARAAGIGFFYLGYAVTGILFVIWQYRHSRNAEALAGPGGLGPAWAIAGWFIPIGALVLPGVELYQSSQASSPPAPGGGPRSGKGSGLVIAWLIAYAIGMIGVSVSLFLDPENGVAGADNLDEVHDRILVGALGGLVLVVAAILGILMVQSLTRAQDRRIAQAQGAGAGQWAGMPPGAWGQPQPAPGWAAPLPPQPQVPQDQPPWGAPPGSPPPPPGPPGGPAPWQPPTQ